MKKEYAPILPFDGTQTDKFEMYDKAVYRFGLDVYKEQPVKMHHSSMIKYYSCKMEDKPVRLGGD